MYGMNNIKFTFLFSANAIKALCSCERISGAEV
jgi:hypothetical protein